MARICDAEAQEQTHRETLSSGVPEAWRGTWTHTESNTKSQKQSHQIPGDGFGK